MYMKDVSQYTKLPQFTYTESNQIDKIYNQRYVSHNVFIEREREREIERERLTGARRDSRAGWALAGGSGAEVEADPLTLLASFKSFFQETMVVSPGRSSTVNICRSPAFTNDDEALDADDSPPATEAEAEAEAFFFSSSMGERIVEDYWDRRLENMAIGNRAEKCFWALDT